MIFYGQVATESGWRLGEGTNRDGEGSHERNMEFSEFLGEFLLFQPEHLKSKKSVYELEL